MRVRLPLIKDVESKAVRHKHVFCAFHECNKRHTSLLWFYFHAKQMMILAEFWWEKKENRSETASRHGNTADDEVLKPLCVAFSKSFFLNSVIHLEQSPSPDWRRDIKSLEKYSPSRKVYKYERHATKIPGLYGSQRRRWLHLCFTYSICFCECVCLVEWLAVLIDKIAVDFADLPSPSAQLEYSPGDTAREWTQNARRNIRKKIFLDGSHAVDRQGRSCVFARVFPWCSPRNLASMHLHTPVHVIQRHTTSTHVTLQSHLGTT